MGLSKIILSSGNGVYHTDMFIGKGTKHSPLWSMNDCGRIHYGGRRPCFARHSETQRHNIRLEYNNILATRPPSGERARRLTKPINREGGGGGSDGTNHSEYSTPCELCNFSMNLLTRSYTANTMACPGATRRTRGVMPL